MARIRVSKAITIKTQSSVRLFFRRYIATAAFVAADSFFSRSFNVPRSMFVFPRFTILFLHLLLLTTLLPLKLCVVLYSWVADNIH